MKVLIETITNRRGYKFFENKDEMDAYLGRHCGKIASYEILNEYDVAVANDVQAKIDEILAKFKISEDYSKVI